MGISRLHIPFSAKAVQQASQVIMLIFFEKKPGISIQLFKGSFGL